MLRHARDDPDPDLIAYLPMDEAEGEAIQDEVPGSQLPRQNTTACCRHATSPWSTMVAISNMENCYSHYQPGDVNVLAWSDYAYRGRMYIASEDSGVGVTFLSHYPRGYEISSKAEAIQAKADFPSGPPPPRRSGDRRHD